MSLSLRGRAVLAAGCVCAFAAAAQAQAFALLGFAPGVGDTGSQGKGVSADGLAVGGYSGGPAGTPTPGFLWTAGAGRYDFGLEAGAPSVTQVYGVSGDGHSVTGAMNPSLSHTEAYRWAGPGTLQGLGTVTGYPDSYGYGISGDGAVVVGTARVSNLSPLSMAFRWTQSTGVQPLGFTRPDHAGHSEASAISRDGSTIVGYSQSTGTGATDAFVWTPGGGMQILPALPTQPNPIANGVNFDGSIVVGLGDQSAMIWRNGVPSDLGVPLGWAHSQANAVSDDGSVVACSLTSTTMVRAGIWTPSRGIEPLASYLAAMGVEVPAGWVLGDSTGVSADGRSLVGTAHFGSGPGQAFVATIPSPGALGAMALAGTFVLARRRRHS